MAGTDHLGRELDSESSSAKTVTEFAVEQGTLDGSAPGVQESIEADEKRAEEHTERAQALSERLSEPAADTTPADEQAEDDRG